MIYVFCGFVGFFIGWTICSIVFGSYIVDRTFGTIKMMESDDGDPYLYLDMDKRPEGIFDRRFVVFKTPKYPHK